MHNAHAPIIVTRLFSTAFCHRGARLIKVNCRRLAYLSACGKYLQLFKVNCRRLAYLSACGKYLQLLMRGAFWLEPQFYVWSFPVGTTTYMTLVSDSKHWSLSATHLLTVKCCTLL